MTIKNISKILIGILLIGSIKMNAQDAGKQQIAVNTTWGIKAEVNLSGFFISNVSVLSSKMKPGFSAGAFLNLEFSEHFALQGELMYHYKTSEFNRESINGKYRYWGMDIPIYAMYQWKLDNKNRFYIGIGPYAEFGFSAILKRDSEKTDLYEKEQVSEISAMKDSNVGFGIIIGYELPNGFQINAGYKTGVTNILDANSNSISLLPNTINLGIGYRFR